MDQRTWVVTETRSVWVIASGGAEAATKGQQRLDEREAPENSYPVRQLSITAVRRDQQ